MTLTSKLFVLFSIVGFTYYYFKYIRKPDIKLNEIEITSLEGEVIDIQNYVGKPLVVNFWATWCAPCIKELAHFKKINNDFKGEIVFLLISEEDSRKIIPFKNSFDFDFVLSSKSFETYGVNTWPTTYFYDNEGNLVNKYNGSLSLQNLKKYVDEIMPSFSKDSVLLQQQLK